MEESINIFYSYAHEDERLRKKLDEHLALLQHQGLITGWNDRDISAGTEWAKEINTHLETAQIILLLVSSSFLASEYCYSREMRRALERHDAGTTRVIPIILRPVYYWHNAPFGKLQALPTDGKPISGGGWRNMDEAFTNVVSGIHKAVNELRAQNSTASQVQGLSENVEHQGRFRPVREIVQRVASQSTLPLIAVREIKPATLNLGDDQSATFPFLSTIFPDIYEQATHIFRQALADPHQRGLLITGAPMAGKTRLAYQAMYEHAPDWLTLTWRRGLLASMIPTPDTLRDQRIILFLDDLQQYADSERSGNDTGASNEFPLDLLYATLVQNALQVVIVATCRATDLSRAETTPSLRWLFEGVHVVAIPFLPNDRETAVVELLKVTNPAIEYHTEDFDNTLGSLLLGLSRKREQYLALNKVQLHPGYLVLRAMKLLYLAGVPNQTKERVRAVAIQALGASKLNNDFKWSRTCEDLDEHQFLIDTGTELVIRKDVYFHKVITDYPTRLRDALLQARRVFQAEGDSEALIALGWVFSKRKAINEMLETAIMAAELAPGNTRTHYLRGRALSSLLRNEEALVSFDQALAIDPTYAAAWNNKGVVLDTLQRYDEAFIAYEEAIKLNPQYIRAWYNKAIVHGELNQYEEALSVYGKAIKLDSQFALAWFNKGVILHRLNRDKEAREAFEEALKVTTLNPNFALGWNDKGIMLGSLGRIKEAMAAFDIAIKLNPQDAGVLWFNKGKVYFDHKNYEEAISCFDRALTLNLQYADAWSYKGFALNRLKRFEEAIACFDKTLSINPQDPEIWNEKGNALSYLGRDEEALVLFDKALTIDPQYIYALTAKSYVLNTLKRYEETLEYCDKALSIYPQYPNPLRHKGNALRGLHRYEEALACFNAALTLNPQYGELWYNKGAVLRQLERAEEALAAYDKAIVLASSNATAEDYEEALAAYNEEMNLNPQNDEIWHKKGIVLGNLKRDEEALAAYDKAIELNPQNVNTLYRKGMTLANLGRDEEALAAYDEAINLTPQIAEIWHKKGIVLERLKRDEEALATYDEAIRLNPQNDKIWHKKGIVLERLRRDEEALAAYDEADKLKAVQPANDWSLPGLVKDEFDLATDEVHDPEADEARDLISKEYLDTDFVLLLRGNNLYGDPLYSYVKLTGRNLEKVFIRMQSRKHFKPADFGTILVAGRGEPPQEIRDEMKKEYNMVDVPMPGKPIPSLQPRFLDDEDI